MNIRRLSGFLVALFACASVNASTFNLFQPATGVLKGNSSTYVTTAAASSDIRALWSGTCNASSYLRGDGACSVPSGSVTSVGLTMPSGLTVTGSPVTSSGTLAVTTLLSGIVKGNGSGFTTAASSDVRGLWSGTCDATTFLRGDGSCVAAGGTTGNPTALVGLTAVNGAASSVMRSDGAPALDQSIAPTWTGIHTWSLAEPRLKFNETDQAANKKLWDIDVNAGLFSIRTRTDVDGAGTTGFSIQRSSTTGITAVVVGDTASSNTAQGTWGFTRGASGVVDYPIQISSLAPGIFINDGDAAANQGRWRLFTDALDDLSWGTISDDGLSTSTFFQAHRSGINIDQLDITAGLILLNGLPALQTKTDVIGSWSGSCSSSTFLRGDGTCAAAGGGTAANPTATIGLTAVNGVATTYTRSDGAPALSQAIVPTWTGLHTFSSASGVLVSAGTVANTKAASSYLPAGVSFSASSVDPVYGWNETDATANSRVWVLGAQGGEFVGRTADDAGANVKTWLDVTRSSSAIASVTLGNATDNPTYSFAGTGATTFGGTIGSGAITSTGSVQGTFIKGTSGGAIGSGANQQVLTGMQYASLTDNGTTCTINSGSSAGTCARNSTGNLTFTFGNALVTAPVCTATPNAASQIAYISARSTTSFTVVTTNLSATAVAATLGVTCMGQ